MDMQEIRNKNDGVKYILVVIDILSWYAWTRPLLSKTAESTNTAFKDIMDISDRSALWIRTDKGGEFAKLKSFTNHFVTQNEPKANYAQRFIKTLKKMITKKMFHANSVSYIDDLQALTKSYNDSYHSSIKMAPSQVNKSNEGVFFCSMCYPIFRSIINRKRSKIKRKRQRRKRKSRKAFDFEWEIKYASRTCVNYFPENMMYVGLEKYSRLINDSREKAYLFTDCWITLMILTKVPFTNLNYKQ